jgi:hypothetical protein
MSHDNKESNSVNALLLQVVPTFKVECKKKKKLDKQITYAPFAAKNFKTMI